jgi:hypothetical protein
MKQAKTRNRIVFFLFPVFGGEMPRQKVPTVKVSWNKKRVAVYAAKAP